mgnify:CR=1 FL=1
MFCTCHIKKVFFRIMKNFNISKSAASDKWKELSDLYCSKNRYYHTFTHINNMLKVLNSFGIIKNDEVCDDKLILAAIYHDAVYNPQKNDNEDKSSLLMERHLNFFAVDEEINLIKKYILATKTHQKTDDEAVNLFIDADMSVLGASAAEYKKYAAQIRKEYAFMSDEQFKKGRLAFLEKTLLCPFCTELFRAELQENAQTNMQNEIESLRKS